MPKKGHYQGAKHRGGHTTVIDVAESLVKTADRLSEVVGIAPGFIDTHAKSKHPRFVFKQIPAGLEVKALGRSSMQTLIIYTPQPDLVEGLLSQQLA